MTISIISQLVSVYAIFTKYSPMERCQFSACRSTALLYRLSRKFLTETERTSFQRKRETTVSAKRTKTKFFLEFSQIKVGKTNSLGARVFLVAFVLFCKGNSQRQCFVCVFVGNLRADLPLSAGRGPQQPLSSHPKASSRLSKKPTTFTVALFPKRTTRRFSKL